MTFESAVAQLEQTNATLVQEVVRFRDAAMGLNSVFSTITEGRETVADGKYFSVPGAGAYMRLYQRNGVSATLIAEYPNPQAVQDIVDALAATLGTAATRDVTTSPTDQTAGRLLRTDDAYAAASDNYHKNNILGTVSQSGGIPTGAIIERGSNSNGAYVKFADGTMICTTIERSTGAINITEGTLFTAGLLGPFIQPKNFIATPNCYASCSNESVWLGVLNHPENSLYVKAYRATSTPSGFTYFITSIGRWY